MKKLLLLFPAFFLTFWVFSEMLAQPSGQTLTAARVRRGTGVPSGTLCATLADVGKVYIRQNAGAVNSSFYTCDNTAASTYAWELGGGGSSVPGGNNKELQYNNSTAFGGVGSSDVSGTNFIIPRIGTFGSSSRAKIGGGATNNALTLTDAAANDFWATPINNGVDAATLWMGPSTPTTGVAVWTRGFIQLVQSGAQYTCAAGTQGMFSVTPHSAGVKDKLELCMADGSNTYNWGIGNCSSNASPAVCTSASAGSVAIPTGVTSVALVVNTTAVTANSQILITSDDSLGTKLGVTCNSTLATIAGGFAVTARTANTSFTITFNGTIATNPVCVSFYIIN